MNKKMMKFSNVLHTVLDWFKVCKGADFPANCPICKMTGGTKISHTITDDDDDLLISA
jgi:hypothetical protein